MKNLKILDFDTITTIGEGNPGDFAIYKIENEKLVALYSSGSMADMIGMSAEEFKNAIYYDANELVVEEDREAVKAMIKKALESYKDDEIVYRVYHKTLGSIWVKAHAGNQ